MVDLLCLPYYTSSFNRTATASRDRSCGRLCCCLPLVQCVVILVVCGIALGLPAFFHSAGVVDLEQRMAGTAGNPYVILDIDRDASAEELQKARAVILARQRGSPRLHRTCRSPDKRSDLTRLDT
eukprot:g25582.t1